MGTYDFGYSPAWTYGHLVPLALFTLLTALAVWRRWHRLIVLLLGALATWALAAFLIVQLVFEPRSPLTLPTATFLSSGRGEVIDLGAGSGRSTLMVLLGRPGTRVTALDIYQGYFGIDENTPDRIRANARAAGMEDRLAVQVGDMREIPLPDDSFDGAVSAFAIDHLRREGITRALAETHRVLRPGSDFLLMVLNVDGWVKVAYPVPHGHGYFSAAPPSQFWRGVLEQAGFEVREVGTRPATLYLLARAQK
jgi:SAM-dependent methyltransferase